MKEKDVIFENPEGVGTFSVGDAVNFRYDKKVTICIARDGIETTAQFFFQKKRQPEDLCGVRCSGAGHARRGSRRSRNS